jgi:hypothetical protein
MVNETTFDELATCYQTAKNSRAEGRCDERAREAGLVPAGSGAFRDVWAVQGADRVVKFATTGGGVESNETETENWHDFDKPTKPLFLPVYRTDEDYDWLTMEEADNVGVSAREMKKMRDNLLRRGWTCRDVHEMNIGYEDGEKKIIDYGEECRRIDQ